jgi:hypothetical protein
MAHPPHIGMGNNNQQNASSYDAIDLLEDNPPNAPTPSRSQRGHTTAATMSERYTIDSDDDGEESSEDDNSSSDDDEEDSEDDDDMNRTTSSATTGANSTAATAVISNVLKNPPAQYGSRSNNHKTAVPVPPASSFNNFGKRFPSYMLKVGDSQRSQGKDKRGRHQRLSTNDEDEEHEIIYDDEESNNKMSLMREPINNIRDPAQFPIEQYTDVTYGGNGQEYASYSYASSYASSDPSSVHYDPKTLRKMEVNDGSDELEQKKRKIIFWGLLTAIFICVLIIFVSMLAHVNRRIVRPPPSNLEDMCDIAKISTKEGYQKCEDACEEATCCMAPGSLSCFKGQEQVCSMVSIKTYQLNVFSMRNELLIIFILFCLFFRFLPLFSILLVYPFCLRKTVMMMYMYW